MLVTRSPPPPPPLHVPLRCRLALLFSLIFPLSSRTFPQFAGTRTHMPPKREPKQKSMLLFTVPRAAYTPGSNGACPISRAEAESVTRAVRDQQASSQGPTGGGDWSPAEKLEIGRKVVEGKLSAVVADWNAPLAGRRKLSKSSASRFATLYREELGKRKRAAALLGEVTEEVVLPPPQKRGRPAILTDSEETRLMQLLRALRRCGTQVSAETVSASARGLVSASSDPSRIDSETALGTEWARKYLAAQGWTLRMRTTAVCHSPGLLERAKAEFEGEVQRLRAQHNIPDDLVVNVDHTALPLLPGTTKTFDKKGASYVPLSKSDEKKAITGVFGASATGDLLPVQLIYGGLTSRSHGRFEEEYLETYGETWHLTANPKHWASEATTLEYIEKVLVPYLTGVKETKGLGEEQKSLLIIDKFTGQQTEKVAAALAESGIVTVDIPPGFTAFLQPLDLGFNAYIKKYLREKFSKWYTGVCTKLFRRDEKRKTRALAKTGTPFLFAGMGSHEVMVYDSSVKTAAFRNAVLAGTRASIVVSPGCADWVHPGDNASGWYALRAVELCLNSYGVRKAYLPKVKDALNLLEKVIPTDTEGIPGAQDAVQQVLEELRSANGDAAQFNEAQRLPYPRRPGCCGRTQPGVLHQCEADHPVRGAVGRDPHGDPFRAADRVRRGEPAFRVVRRPEP